MRARIFAEENRRWWTLGALSFALFMIMLDNTIVNVALPAIKNDLHIGVSELEWVVTAYALTFAVLLLTRSEEHTSELQSRLHLVCRLLLEKKKKKINDHSLYGSEQHHGRCV